MGFVKKMFNSLWKAPKTIHDIATDTDGTLISGEAIDKMEFLLKELKMQIWERAEEIAQNRNPSRVVIESFDVETAFHQLQQEGR